MPIPDYQTIMLPLLRFAGDGEEHSVRDTIEALATQFKLTGEERKELLPSGQQATFDNRVRWSRTYISKAGLIANTRRGFFRITDRGLAVLSEKPNRVNVRFLERFPEFVAFRSTRKEKANLSDPSTDQAATPEEALESAYAKLREGLAMDLLQTVKECSPSFFEHLVIDLLVKMGYGGSRKEAGQAVGKGGDGGIDGIIKEDKLGLDIIYIQAKRWDNTVVGRPEVQKFAGALQGHRARKGIFLTTSTFSREALDYVTHIDSKIILIDGALLADLMIDHSVGVSPLGVYEVKRIDTDYFIEE